MTPMMMRFTLLAVALVALSTQMKARAAEPAAPILQPVAAACPR